MQAEAGQAAPSLLSWLTAGCPHHIEYAQGTELVGDSFKGKPQRWLLECALGRDSVKTICNGLLLARSS